MFSIGEFSKITGLSVKTLRFYHEQGLLAPSSLDDQTGYRYYDSSKIEVARVIAQLRSLEVPLTEIAEILRDCHDESDVLGFLKRHQKTLAAKADHYRQIEAQLDQLINQETEARTIMKNGTFDVEEKNLESMLIAGVRMKGRYSDCGKGFSQIGKKLGRYLGGPCFLLHYDDEYEEDDADFEACFPLRTSVVDKKAEGIAIRQLPGRRCAALSHRGPYGQLGRSYEKILKYVKSKGYEIEMPTREVYLKGPGMIFKGNPKKYLTEIQIPIKPS